MRRLTLDDADLMLAVWNDPAFIRYVGDRGIRTLEHASTELENGAMRLYRDYGFGPFRVSLKYDDTAIGVSGVFRRESLDDPDLGFAMLPGFCGQGYAYESACAVVDHARADLRLPRLSAIVSPENEASVRLIEKLGMQFERIVRMPGDDHDIHLYGIELTN